MGGGGCSLRDIDIIIICDIYLKSEVVGFVFLTKRDLEKFGMFFFVSLTLSHFIEY